MEAHHGVTFIAPDIIDITNTTQTDLIFIFLKIGSIVGIVTSAVVE